MNTEIMALIKDIQDRVREVAYMMWESAGRQHGMAMNYWLAAERDVIETMQSAAERMIPADPPSEGDAAASPASAPPAQKPAPRLETPVAKAAPVAPPPQAKQAAPAKAAASKVDPPSEKEPVKPAAKAPPKKPAARVKPKT